MFPHFFFFFFFFFSCCHNSESSGRYAIVFLPLYLLQTAEAVELLHNNDGDKENTTYLYRIRFARILLSIRRL